MDLTDALNTLRKPLYLDCVSDAGLLKRIEPRTGPTQRELHDVPELNGRHVIRMWDALLSLAQATRPRYLSGGVYRAHAPWAILRYLGLFEETPTEHVRLSPAGRRIRGHQRGALSEDLGIAFATLFAPKWLTPNDRIGVPSVIALDIDALLSGGYPPPFRVTVIDRQRPDYLLIGDDPDLGPRIGLLECKGAAASSTRRDQLVSANAQLRGTTVDDEFLPGLAVSTLATNHSITCNAFQVLPETEVDLSRLTHETRDLAALRRRARIASWAALADFAANTAAMAYWSRVDRLDPGFGDGPGRPEDRHFEAPDGTAISGISQLVTLPGGPLQIVMGVLTEVDEALSSGDTDAVTEAQQHVRSSLRHSDHDTGDAVMAYHASGAAIYLNPLG